MTENKRYTTGPVQPDFILGAFLEYAGILAGVYGAVTAHSDGVNAKSLLAGAAGLCSYV